MEIKELKDEITSGNISDDFKVFLCEENHFLAFQYLEQIAKTLNMEIRKVNELSETINATLSLLMDTSKTLNYIVEDVFKETSSNYSKYKNTIVICDKVDKNILKLVEPYIIKMPILKEWQIKDYMKILCPKIKQEDLDWLYDAAAGDIYRITNELDKINLFKNLEDKKRILNEIKLERNSDLYQIGYLDLTNAIINKDSVKLKEFLLNCNTILFEPIGLVTTLLANYKKILLIVHNPNTKPECIGASLKQFNFMKFKYSNIPLTKLMNNIEFLSGIDERLKTYKLDMPKKQLFEYILINIL